MMSTHVTGNGDSAAATGGRSDSVASNGQAKSGRWHAAAAFESGQQIQRHIPRLIFDPDSGLVCYWTALVAAATLYNAWMTALRIAFPETRQSASTAYLDLLSDFIYLMDVLVQLRTAYLQDGIPVFEPSKIRHQYISQPHFARDLISVLPSQTLLSFLPDSVGCCKFFLCTAGAARLTRLLKFHILYKFYDLAESLTSNPHLIRVLRLFLNLGVVIHWIACLYYLLSEFEGLGSNDWVYTNATDQQRFTRKYIVCLYWSTMTLTTIGNTNSPETDIEYIFTGVTFMTGVFVFATVMGNVGDVISSMNANRQEFQARMDHIKMYLTHKKVPASLQLKIKKWAEYTWSRTKATDESRLLNMLPERLRAEVAVHVHLDSLKKVKIFEQCETGFLCELVLKLRSQVFSPGDYVCRAGETGREMFIINHGKVEVLVPSSAHKDMVVAALSEGNYFGEISLLRLDGVQNRRTADVRSIGYSELLCLSRRDLMSALVEYPEAKSVLESQAKKRMRTNLQAQRAFSVDTLLRSSQDHSSADSGTAGKDEGRGHDVSEIKAMIEDLKNANKVPGRTVWQLIARCEVLQAKLSEKEKEIEDSKQRVKDLEDLLVARHSLSNESPGSPTTPISRDPQVDADRHLLRPGTKVTKQFSQDEGRHVTSDHAVENLEQGRHQACNENMVVPDVKVTGPPLPAKCVSSWKDSSSPNCKALDEDNFIRTSKITHISYDQDAPSLLFEREDQPEPMAPALRGGDGAGSVRIRSQNIVKNGSCYHESSYHQKITLKNFEELSFMTSFNEEFSISDSYGVETIPEEDEDAVDEAVGISENLPITSNSRLPRTTVEYNAQNKVAQCDTFFPPSTTPGPNVNTLTKTSIDDFDRHSKVSSQYEIHSPLSKRSTVNNSSHTSSNDGELKETSQKSVPDTNSDANKTIDNQKDAARPDAKCSQFGSSSSGESRDTNSKFKSSVSVSDKLAGPNGQSSHSYSLAPEATGTGRSGDRRRVLSRGQPDFPPDIPVLNRLCSSLERMSDLDELDEGIGFLGMGSLSGRLSGDSPPRRNSWGSEDETDEDAHQ